MMEVFYFITTVVILAFYMAVSLVVAMSLGLVIAAKTFRLPADVVPGRRYLALAERLFKSDARSKLVMWYPLALLVVFVVILRPILKIVLSEPDFAWTPRLTSQSVDLRTLFHYITSLSLGVFLAFGARVVDFNFGYGDIRIVKMINLFLLGAATVGGLAALVDNLLRVHFLAFTAFAASFIAVYALLVERMKLNINRAVNLTDLGALRYIAAREFPRRTIHCRLTTHLKGGYVFEAHLLWTLYRISRRLRGRPLVVDKDLMKLEAMLYYRRERYSKVAVLASRGNATLEGQGDFSETLTSFEALACIQIGQSERAVNLLKDALARFPKNPFFMYHLSYACWQKHNLPEALDWISRSIETFRAFRPDQITPAIGFKAYLLCDLAITNYPQEKHLLPDRIAEAKELIRRAMEDKKRIELREGIKLGDQLAHTLGYVYMLDRRYSQALEVFSGCAWRSAHLGSRLRIAILRMIGTKDYTTSISGMEWILNTLYAKGVYRRILQPRASTTYPDRFRRLVELNLERAAAANTKRRVLNDEIVFYQLTAHPLLPSESLVPVSEESSYIAGSLTFKRFDFLPMRLSWRQEAAAPLEQVKPVA